MAILLVTREVQVFQWSETETTEEEQIGPVRRTNKYYRYEAEWGSHIDSSHFHEREYRENIRPSIDSK